MYGIVDTFIIFILKLTIQIAFAYKVSFRTLTLAPSLTFYTDFRKLLIYALILQIIITNQQGHCSKFVN